MCTNCTPMAISADSITTAIGDPVTGGALSHAAPRETERLMAQVQKQAWHMHSITITDRLLMHDQSQADIGTVSALILISDAMRKYTTRIFNGIGEPIGRCQLTSRLRMQQQSLISPPSPTITTESGTLIQTIGSIFIHFSHVTETDHAPGESKGHGADAVRGFVIGQDVILQEQHRAPRRLPAGQPDRLPRSHSGPLASRIAIHQWFKEAGLSAELPAQCRDDLLADARRGEDHRLDCITRQVHERDQDLTPS